VDRLIAQGRRSVDEKQRAEAYIAIQETLNRELPYVHLWWADNVLVHTRRLENVHLTPAGNYDFLRDSTLAH
jgi:peptide/nickel transport system substrate-binding protein